MVVAEMASSPTTAVRFVDWAGAAGGVIDVPTTRTKAVTSAMDSRRGLWLTANTRQRERPRSQSPAWAPGRKAGASLAELTY